MLDSFYTAQLRQGKAKKDALLRGLQQQGVDLKVRKQKHDNQALRDLLTNANTTERIEIQDDGLLQHVDPIYQQAHRQGWSLFPPQHFFSPNKMWFGRPLSTPAFFLWVALWYMLALFALLRLDLLQYVTQGLRQLLNTWGLLNRGLLRGLRYMWILQQRKK